MESTGLLQRMQKNVLGTWISLALIPLIGETKGVIITLGRVVENNCQELVVLEVRNHMLGVRCDVRNFTSMK